MKYRIRKWMKGLLILVFLVSTALLIHNFISYGSGEAAYADAARLARSQDAPSPEAEPAETTLPPEPGTVWIPAPVEDEDPNLELLAQTDLSALRQVSPDVVGWIQIPGTEIDYPLMQGTDNEFYLNNNWRGVKEYVGSIFLEYRSNADMTDFNTIVYGHNMSNGSMFGSLHRYQYPAYLEEHPYVYIVTDAGILRYEVFSTYNAEVNSPTYGLSFHQMETRAEYLTMALENSEIDTGIIPELTDRILTLSTCNGMGYASRRVVHARLKMIEITIE